MIISIKHKGLKRFYLTGTAKGIRADHVSRLQVRLAVLEAATCIEDIAVHNWDLHALTGNFLGQYAIRVSGNWRLFFKFIDGDVYLLDYDDYH